ncbi:MAG: tyrosine-type recombinase/integrase [Planctomycetales bacterium]|nr:tyrosine-type recombinase/integrase [Planctomycetales bacterium]
MAWLEQQKSGVFVVCFRYGGARLKRSTKTRSADKAERMRLQIEENIELVERGRLEVPADADLMAFLVSDGRLTSKRKASGQLPLGTLFEKYRESLPRDSHAPESLRISKIHMRHVARILGQGTRLVSITAGDLQRYVSKRSEENGHRGRKVSTGTIRKEMATFRTLWRWAKRFEHVSADFPNHGLHYPLQSESPPFLTWEEIERRIDRGLVAGKIGQLELWDSLYLNTTELEELLGFIQAKSSYGFLSPMVVMASHTGARRSEICRSRTEDIDFESDILLIREKKRLRGKQSFRHVPISPFLKETLREWCKQCGHTSYTFPLDHRVRRSRNAERRENWESVAPDEASDHLDAVLSGSKWKHIRGWHVFRHSFISNCASAAVDQRMIDAWVGHQTEEMRRRYRHLFPSSQRRELAKVFG